MALTAEEVEATMDCDNDAAASGASAGKRPAEALPMGEPTPARVRPPVGPQVPAGKVKKLGWLTVSCPANKQGQLTFADVEDAISILLMDLTDESREGGAIEGIPTSPRLISGKLIVDTADSSRLQSDVPYKTSKDEGAHAP
ncbi:hypothetical protein AB1Y20_023694 [Prymnesium parvum]|uniref:Uncharacterized protein n=1 Tax=Prymnesium parvum TaxID=97485 RepID=A0AB34JHV2_PRYPA